MAGEDSTPKSLQHKDVLPPEAERPRLPGETVGPQEHGDAHAQFETMRTDDQRAFVRAQIAAGKSVDELVTMYGETVRAVSEYVSKK